MDFENQESQEIQEPDYEEQDTGQEEPQVQEQEPDYDSMDLEDLPLFGPVEEESEDSQEEPEESQEEEPEEQESQEGQKQEQQEPWVEVDGTPIPISQAAREAHFGRMAARELSQVREELNRQNAIFDEFAALAGMDRPAYFALLQNQLHQAKLEKEAGRLGVSPEAANQVLQAQERERQAQQAARQAWERQQAAFRQEQERKSRVAPFVELLRRYPELNDPAKMPPEVSAQIRQGVNPVIAYQDYQLRRSQAEQQVQRQKQQVRNKATGSAASAGDGQVDEAIAAFMAEFEQ